METCNICPRKCGVKRESGKSGYCGTDARILVSRAALHYWEEPCISGEEGSGTVFFSGCNLHCIYCQNYRISDGTVGAEVTVSQLANLFLRLQEQNANNINLVTPTHYAIPIKEALLLAKKKGLTIPIVYNCGGYESVETLRELDGLIDIYLTDFKYMDKQLANDYSAAPDYPEVAKKALAEMVRQQKNAVFAARKQGVPAEKISSEDITYSSEEGLPEDGIMKKGVIVRHLLLPGCKEDSKRILSYLRETYGNQIFISIMSQYTPLPRVEARPELNRKITKEEYEEIVDYAIEIGIENGFIQEGDVAEESFIPDFDDLTWRNGL